MGLGLGVANAQAQQTNPMQVMPMGAGSSESKPAGSLKISYGDKSAEWTPVSLAALPHKTVTVHNEHTKAERPTPECR
jgi:hypothetical protein